MTAGARMLYEQSVKKFPAMMGRLPTAEDLAKLEFHAKEFSKPFSEMNPIHREKLEQRLQATTPAKDMLVDEAGRAYQPIHSIDQSKGLITPEQAQGYTNDQFGSTAGNFRAREGLYAPDVQAFESRDPFLTQAMTGRPPSGTRQKPFTTNIDDLAANRASLEAKGQYGDIADVSPGGYPAQSTTPSADYFANMAAKIEAAKLPANIQSTLREALGRQPTEDEINAAIANLNVAGHDYTGKGAAVFAERPPTKRGTLTAAEKAALAEWRQQAIDSGMSRTAVNASPSDLAAKFPGIAAEQELGPALPFKRGGDVHPDNLRAEMIVHGYEPKKFAEGKSTGVLGTDYQPVYNPQATMQATPFISSEQPFTDYVKGAVAPVLGQMATDRIFGGPQSGEEAIYTAGQMFNPATVALSTLDAIPNTYRNLKNKDYLGAGISGAGAALGLIPALKPIKKFLKK
jgi:hypothetical protein